jgi:hypothetical protein
MQRMHGVFCRGRSGCSALAAGAALASLHIHMRKMHRVEQARTLAERGQEVLMILSGLLPAAIGNRLA